MSDHKYGEPVEDSTAHGEATSADEAVARAHEGLADAEAASREAAQGDVTPGEAAAHERVVDDGAGYGAAHDATVAHDSAAHDTTAAHDATAAHPVEPATTAAPAAGSLYADDPVDETYTPGAYSSGDYSSAAATEVVTPAASQDAATEVVAPAVVAPVVTPVVETSTPQPIFVQAPEAPRPRGNRAAAGLIGLLAAVVFGILYLAAALGLRALDGDVTGANVGTEALAALGSWWFWVPVVVFYLAFWLLGAIINRGSWAHWVIFGLFVGLASYGGHLLGQLFQAPFWQLTASQGEEVVRGQLLAPLAIVAFVLGRELTIWFGGWVAARGKRVSELNREAQREYERTLEAGPRLHQG
ncbi:ABC transporter [Microbacterium sp. F2E]|uniref:ABC transporter n=1 Tax=Microbacterium sp. F2E TaxID=2895284 RepID=UPI001E28DAE0|nr:ABC transporter [Microbacterium sp. F2E]MCC9053323.1 ABC transporter [Microbacterium sp. F2E]